MASRDALYMDKPLPFIETGPDGRMAVNESVVRLLEKVRNPVSVISIVGKYRTGKSYLMNRFFDTNAGFNLGPTIQATTKGIWIWVRPHPNDPQRTLVLLDTEGLHDVEKGDETHDMKLFSLALLLSSCLVYNATGTLDDIIIQQLHLVSELTEHIKTKESGEEDGNHFNKYFPSFFLVLRDFFLKLEIDGRPCSPDMYLENALRLKTGQTRKVRDYNTPRECIRSFFPRRRCFVLCKPVEDDDKLAHLDQVSEREIKTKFLDAAAHATQQILADAKPFQVDGNMITGPRYAQLAISYTKALNDGAIPCIASAVELLKNTECQKAMEESASIFDSSMRQQLQGKLPVTQDIMTQAQKVAHAAAIDHYSKGALFDSEQVYVTKLSENLDRIFQSHIEENNTASRMKCEQVLQQLFAGIESNIEKGDYTGKGGYRKYSQDRDGAVQKYKASQDLGPLADEALSDFLHDREAQEKAIISADKAMTAKEKELAIEEERRKREEKRAVAAEAEKQRMMQQMIAQQEAHQDTIQRVQNDFAEQQRKLLDDHKRDMCEKEEEYKRMMQEGLTKQAEQYGTLIDDMKKDKARMEEDYKQQAQQLKQLGENNKDILRAMKEQGEMNEKQMKLMSDQIDHLSRQKDEGSGPEAFLGFIGKIAQAAVALKTGGKLGKVALLFTTLGDVTKSSKKNEGGASGSGMASTSSTGQATSRTTPMDLD